MKRTELFSLRRSAEEVQQFTTQKEALYNLLEENSEVHIVSVTEVDRNPLMIAEAFRINHEYDDSIENYIFVNAIDTEDSSSFVDCFFPLVSMLEEAMDCSIPYKEDGVTLESHVNVSCFEAAGTDIKGYCFYAIDKRFIFLPAFSLTKGVTLPEFIASSVKSAHKVLDEKLRKYPKGTVILNKATTKYLKPKGRVKHFIMSFIPHKGDRVKDVLRKLIVLLAIGVFIAGGVILLNFYVFMPMENQSVISEIQDIFYATADEIVISTKDEEGNIVEIKTTGKNWKGIKKINEEIVAWVKLDGTKIDYPVLEHKGDDADNQFYLYRNYKKDYSDFGSIFVDYRCLDSVKSKNLIFHGHNMGSDDSMFGQLMNYARNEGSTKGNPKYYKSAPIVTVDTPEGSNEYIIFAVMKIDVSNDLENVFDYLIADFDSDARFMNFVYNLKIRSYLDVEVPINEDDTLLTLSTCSYETDNMRTIVVARKVRENEDTKPYIESAKASRPVNIASSSFSQELNDKNITWYDGKGNLEGDEEVRYMTQSKMYTVKFLGADGKPISTQIIIEGKDAKAPKENPRKAADGKHYYVFKGWDSVYTNVTKDLTVKPIFEKKKMPTATTEPTTEPTTAAKTEAPPEPEQEITDAPEIPEEPEIQPPATQAPPTQAPETLAPTQAPTEPPTEAPLPETEAPAPETTGASVTEAPATEANAETSAQ